MARKEDIIGRLNELASILGRDIDTSGNIAELEQTLREAEDEVAMLSEESGHGGENITGDGAALGVGAQADATVAGDALISIKVAKTLHVRAAHGKHEVVRIVRQGQEVTMRASEFAKFKPGLAKRVQ